MASNSKEVLLWVLLGVIAIGLTVAGGCSSSQNKTGDISPEEALVLIQKNQPSQNLIIIDVRTAEEFAGGHLEKAINIDFYASTFREELSKLDRDKTYLIYCHSGARSSRALAIMEELNFREVYNISGGITAWQAAGLPMVVE